MERMHEEGARGPCIDASMDEPSCIIVSPPVHRAIDEHLGAASSPGRDSVFDGCAAMATSTPAHAPTIFFSHHRPNMPPLPETSPVVPTQAPAHPTAAVLLSPAQQQRRRTLYSSTSGAAVCRICRSGEESGPLGEPLVSPCRCSGTMGLYHRSCLESWLSVARSAVCEICHHDYGVTKKRRPLAEFMHAADYTCERRHLLADMACWLVLTPLAVASAALCIQGAINIGARADPATDQPEQFDPVRGIYTPATATERSVHVSGLLVLAAFIVVTYCVWLCLAVRYHTRIIFEWRNQSQRIVLKRAPTPHETKLARKKAALASPPRAVDDPPRVHAPRHGHAHA